MQDVTSTEVSALFGLSPYISKFELWYRKRHQEIAEFIPNERMVWGNRLESAIAYGIAEDENWEIEPFKDYGRLEKLRMGSSFDFVITDKGNPTGLLEIKNVDFLQFRDKWIVEDGVVIEAPAHIEIQCQQQLAVSGLSDLYIGVLIGGNTVAKLHRTPSIPIIDQIKEKVIQFWESIKNNEAPEPDFKKDFKFITELYSDCKPGKIIESNDQIAKLVDDYKKFADAEKEFGKCKQATKAELLTLIGESEKVLGEGFSISAGMVGESEVSYTRKPYRNFRVHIKKEKK